MGIQSGVVVTLEDEARPLPVGDPVDDRPNKGVMIGSDVPDLAGLGLLHNDKVPLMEGGLHAGAGDRQKSRDLRSDE